jgi:hypothetical protein
MTNSASMKLATKAILMREHVSSLVNLGANKGGRGGAEKSASSLCKGCKMGCHGYCWIIHYAEWK